MSKLRLERAPLSLLLEAFPWLPLSPQAHYPFPRLTENKTRSFLNLQIIKQLFFSSFRFHISHLCLQSGLHVGVQGKRCSWVWGSQEESQAVRPLPHPCPELGTEAPCLGHLLLARYCS